MKSIFVIYLRKTNKLRECVTFRRGHRHTEHNRLYNMTNSLFNSGETVAKVNRKTFRPKPSSSRLFDKTTDPGAPATAVDDHVGHVLSANFWSPAAIPSRTTRRRPDFECISPVPGRTRTRGNVVVVVTAKRRGWRFTPPSNRYFHVFHRPPPYTPGEPHRASFWFYIIKQIITSNNNITIMTMIMVGDEDDEIMTMTASTTAAVYGHPKSCVYFPIRLITCSLTRAITF